MFSLKPTTSKCYSKQELDSVLKNIKAKKNTIILGPERIGKTSFLLSIKGSLKKAGQHPILFTKAHDLNTYIRQNLLSILSAFPIDEPKQILSQSLLELDKTISAMEISDDAKQAVKLLLLYESDNSIDLETVVKQLFSLPALLSKDSVILIDDADLLKDTKDGKTSVSMVLDSLQEFAPVVLASSQRLKIELEEIALSPLTIDDARDLLSSNELELDEKALNNIYNTTEGVPFYINHFARLLKFTGRFDPESINAMIEDSLDNDLHMYYSEKLHELSPKELPILLCMAEHNVNTPSRISKLLNYSQTNVRRFLSIMEEKGFVTLKERGVFKIHDPVFRRWLERKSR